MTNSPDDRIDPYEARLARRVSEFSEQAVRPIDAAAIAAAAHAGARRSTFTARLFGSNASIRRLGVVLAGALVGVLALGVWIGAGGRGVTHASNQPGASPTDAAGVAGACKASDLSGLIMAWEGAAGHRIATIRVENAGSDCVLPQVVRPALIDADGNALIVGAGAPQPAPIAFPAGAAVTTMVDMANYCGAAPSPPDKPLAIRLYLSGETSIEVRSAASLPLPADPPPCNGPNASAEIQIQPFQLAN